MGHVSSEDISVMIQGPYIENHTPHCVASIRRWLPKAEIVYSTWRGKSLEPFNDLDVDTLVLSDDPSGPNISRLWADAFGSDCVRAQSPATTLYNLNREILSSHNGLKKVSRSHTLRLRSDGMLIGLGFLDYFGKYDQWRGSDYRIFKKRIVAMDAYSPTRSAFCLYFNDFCSFGLTEDVQEQWRIPLQPDPEEMADSAYNPLLLIGEQYFWVSLLNRHFHVYPRHMYHKSPELIAITEASIANNVTIVDFDTFGFFWLKSPNQNQWNYTRFTQPWCERISHAEWQLWCRKHCGLPTPSASAEELHEIDLKNRFRAAYAEFLKWKGLEETGKYTDALYAITCYDEFLRFGAERGIFQLGG